MNITLEKPKIFYDSDAHLEIIQNKKVLIIGYGNQGRAQAKNLSDSGIEVYIGLREKSTSWNKVKSENLIPMLIKDAIIKVDIISMLVPDEIMFKVYSEICQLLKKKQILLFSHGYNIFYEKITPPKYIDVIMVAPSGAGKIVRESFKKNSGVPNLIAIHQDYSGNALDVALAYSKAIGGTRAGAFLSSFQEETETDLFGEQVVLCGGIPKLIETAFNVLVEAGYQPIVAWFVCFYEVKLIVDLFHEIGFSKMYESISTTAKFGGLKTGDRIISEEVKLEMEKIVTEIKNKEFFKSWETDTKNNYFELNKMKSKQSKSLFEQMTKIINQTK
jgi:ketol-acid reductoisomerase